MFVPLEDRIIITDIEQGMQRTDSGIYLGNHEMKVTGIRPRWARVSYVGDNVIDVKVGEWILLQHGRWSRIINYKGEDMQMADPNGILMIADKKPTDKEMGEWIRGKVESIRH